MVFLLHVLVRTADMGQFGFSIDMLSSVIDAYFRSLMKFCALSLPASLQSSQFFFLAGRRMMSACRLGKNVKTIVQDGISRMGRNDR